EPTRDEQRLTERFGVKPVRRSAGCPACGQTGYHGRMPVLEVLVVTPKLGGLISTGKTVAELEQAATAGGMTPLLVNGLAQVTQGKTTLQEVARVLGGETDTDEAAGTGKTAGASAATREPSARILVVDDDAVQRTTARKLLETAGFVVDDAVDGSAAL